MGRPILVLVRCAATLGACAGAVTFSAAGVAQASPLAPPPPPCSFVLSSPTLDVGTVTATVQSTGCAPWAAPYSAVACLQPDGGAIRCEQAHGADPARVAVPFSPGVTIVATGRGCAGWVGLPPAPDCQLLGPDSVTP